MDSKQTNLYNAITTIIIIIITSFVPQNQKEYYCKFLQGICYVSSSSSSNTYLDKERKEKKRDTRSYIKHKVDFLNFSYFYFLLGFLFITFLFDESRVSQATLSYLALYSRVELGFLSKQAFFFYIFNPGQPGSFEMKIQEQFKNISRTYQYFSKTQATFKIL